MREPDEHERAKKFIEAGLGHNYQAGATMPDIKITDPKALVRQKERALARAKTNANSAQMKLRKAEQDLEAAKMNADPHARIAQLIWLKLIVAFDLDAFDASGKDEFDEDIEGVVDDLIERVKDGRFGPRDFGRLATAFNSCVPASDRVRLREITRQIVDVIKSADMEMQ